MATDMDIALFEEELFSRIDPYVPYIKLWYDKYYDHIFDGVGSFDCPSLTNKNGEVIEAPSRLMYRFNMSEQHSAIKGLQAFPFVQISCLNLPKATGGVRNMVSRIVGNGWYDYGDIFFILKQSLVNTANAQMFLAFITPDMYDKLPRGSYVWLTEQEIMSIYNKVVPESVKRKAYGWLNVSGRATSLKRIASTNEVVKISG
jgi:hypothetical protein